MRAEAGTWGGRKVGGGGVSGSKVVKRGMHNDYLSAPLPEADARALIYVRAEVALAPPPQVPASSRRYNLATTGIQGPQVGGGAG